MTGNLVALSWPELFAARARVQGAGVEIASFIGDAGRPELIAFSGGFPEPETFDLPQLQELAGSVMLDPLAVQYGPTVGDAALRAWLRTRLGQRDADPLGEDELMMTSGGMEGLALINRCLLDRGDRVLVEAPTFLGVIAAIGHAEGRISAVDLDDDGLDTDRLAAVLAAGTRFKYLYVIPDFQNPTGRRLSLPRRQALIELARRYGLLVIEDVAYRELSFDGSRLPSLRSLGPDVVIQLGTFAKTFCPGLRLGWLSGPAPLVAEAVRAKQYTDQFASAFGQRLLEAFARSGGFERSLDGKRALYRRRCELMLTELGELLPEPVRFTRPAGGFFTWLTLPADTDTTELPRLASERAVAFLPGQPFYPDGRGGNELRLSFSKVPDDQIAEGVRRLAEVLASLL